MRKLMRNEVDLVYPEADVVSHVTGQIHNVSRDTNIPSPTCARSFNCRLAHSKHTHWEA